MENVHLAALRAYYGRLDGRTAGFRSAGLCCARGCGLCCETGDPEITAFEALPLAMHILSDSGLLARYEAYRRSGAAKPCFFYDAAADYGCTVYAIRPMICRMFGYAGGRDKHGRPRFVPCARMENANRTYRPDDAPVFQDLHYELLSFAPPELARVQAFADALAEAVDREGMRRELRDPKQG